MYLEAPLPFIKDFVNELNRNLISLNDSYGLSKTQRYWLGFCILGILLTNSVCWARIERLSLQTYSQSALSWMFRHSKIPWSSLLLSSTMGILNKYNIDSGVLSLDDSDNPRGKTAKHIHKTHKLKDKGSGGYINGQSLVVMVLVSDKITLPVGFCFYAPDPATKAWEKEDKRLRKKGVKKKLRPQKPVRDSQYPTKEELALKLLACFSANFPHIQVYSIVADALYGTDSFLEGASKLFENAQVVSQLRSNQIIQVAGEPLNIKNAFQVKPYYKKQLKIRDKTQEVRYSYMVAKVKAHDWKKRLIVALKYQGEDEYRYLVASNPSWNAEKVIQVYTLRWLVEVFFQDWKSYEGWGQLAKHTGYEGSSRGLILSLLLDHCLFLHPEQIVRIGDKLPACTVGSLREKIIAESLVLFINNLLNEQDPKQKLELLAQNADSIFKPNQSSKHLNAMNCSLKDFKTAA